MNLNSESSRRLPWIDLVERNPASILLLSAAALLKPFGEFFGAMDIEKFLLEMSGVRRVVDEEDVEDRWAVRMKAEVRVPA
jgi:hypothetical protein